VAPNAATSGPAKSATSRDADAELDDLALFPRPAMLQPAIAFWTDIFSKYSQNQSVIHSYDDPSRIFAVLDFDAQAQTLSPAALEQLRFVAERQAREEVDATLKSIDSKLASGQPLDGEEYRIARLFDGDSDPQRFKKAIGSARVQHGLRERTDHALEIAAAYLPQMEKTFAGYGLPVVLTRLPLVESSFNFEARSKDNAVGLWQFMPAAARGYMRYNDIVDDRRDPWYSTDGAARHLKDDYAALGQWSLALTAYNVGRGGVLRGLKAVGGTGLEDLLNRYQNPHFGFASKNFYAEFLAAADVERAHRLAAGGKSAIEAPRFDTITTRDYVPYDALQRLSGADASIFAQLNPAFRREVVEGRLYVPPGQPLRLPAGMEPHFLAAYEQLPDSERFDAQRIVYVSYKLRRGDSLETVARRFGMKPAQLLAANDLDEHAALHSGMTLRVAGRVASHRQKPHLVSASIHKALVRKEAVGR
jgi:membrane-bound lytic murein transglycosylase D